MKKIVVFKTNAFPIISETFIVNNIVQAVEKGYDIRIIVDHKNDITNTSQLDVLDKYGLMNKVLKFSSPKRESKRYIKGIKIIIRNPVLIYYFLKYIFYNGKASLEYLFILNFYLQFRSIETFHIHFATAINPLFELKKIGFIKSKIIVTFHGYDAHVLPDDDQINDVRANFDKWVYCITVNSEYLKKKLIEKGFNPSSIKIIPIGIDTNFFQNNLNGKTVGEIFRIISVGRLIELKGHALGIKAIKLLKDKGYKVDYTIVGIGEELDYLQQLTVELNLEEIVHFYGYANQLEIKKLLQESDLFLMTSTKDKFDRCEAFGVVSLEAQSMGLPIAGFDTGGFPETIIEGKTGFAIKDKDIHVLTEVVERLINDDEIRTRIGMAAKKHIKDNFDTKTVTSRYIDLYY